MESQKGTVIPWTSVQPQTEAKCRYVFQKDEPWEPAKVKRSHNVRLQSYKFSSTGKAAQQKLYDRHGAKEKGMECDNGSKTQYTLKNG